MKTITTISEIQSLAESLRKEGKRIGFVPTMGFLHEGHLSLMRKAREDCDVVVASIFVNPAQFGPNEDLDRYPRDAEGDRRKCGSAGVDVLFMPEVKDMYPEKPTVYVTILGISDILEGAARPGHFRGVATVVAKLFNLVKPHRAYFGQKDFQQCVVLERMVAGLNMNVEVVVLPTVREADGLAMSSRNSYLNAEERRAATVLFKALTTARDLFKAGATEPEKLKKKMQAVLLEEKHIEVDYIEVADPETLAPLESASSRMVLLVAARLGATRLIDNLLVL
ncbi:MAG TPA: pantoate--beta-alanine ligase [Nitrospirota bacterium]|nr:pantoate--beta-alanine ligase [Nitrospirota bacterium]